MINPTRPYLPFPPPNQPVDDNKENDIKKQLEKTSQNTEQEKNQVQVDKVSINNSQENK